VASYNPALPISHFHAALTCPDRHIRPSLFTDGLCVNGRLVVGGCGIGGPGFVDRHARTLSLEAGVSEKGQTNYLWAPPFPCCRDSEEGDASPNRSLETASVGLSLHHWSYI